MIRIAFNPSTSGFVAVLPLLQSTARNADLHGLITRRSKVQILPPQPTTSRAYRFRSVSSLSIWFSVQADSYLIDGEAINTERQARLDEARQTIREHPERRCRGASRKSWIKALRREARAA